MIIIKPYPKFLLKNVKEGDITVGKSADNWLGFDGICLGVCIYKYIDHEAKYYAETFNVC